MHVNNQVLAKEPDINSIGATKLKMTAIDRERSNFDTILASFAWWLKELVAGKAHSLIIDRGFSDRLNL